MQASLPSQKPAFLIVGYGAYSPTARAVYREIENNILHAYPDYRVVWAYSSEILREKLRQEGNFIPSVEEALSLLNDESVSQVVILPLFVVQGEAYTTLKSEVRATLPLPCLQNYVIASPLLHDARDSEIVSHALLNSLPDKDECPEKILFMGHGCQHEAGNAAYDDVDDLIDRMHPGARLALLSGESFETLLAEWGEGEGEEILLRPFFFTMGHHSFEDLSGNHPQSWKMRLENMGYVCHVDLTSLSEMPEIAHLLMEHLSEALAEL